MRTIGFGVEVRAVFGAFMREQVVDIDYPNFKGRLHERNRSVIGIEREQFAYRVWQSGCEYQWRQSAGTSRRAFTGVAASVSSQGELSMMRRWLRLRRST